MKYEKWTIAPEPAAPWLFCLSEEVTRERMDKDTKVKTGETYSSSIPIAYGLKFVDALRMVATIAADKTTIAQYIRDWERISGEIGMRGV